MSLGGKGAVPSAGLRWGPAGAAGMERRCGCALGGTYSRSVYPDIVTRKSLVTAGIRSTFPDSIE